METLANMSIGEIIAAVVAAIVAVGGFVAWAGRLAINVGYIRRVLDEATERSKSTEQQTMQHARRLEQHEAKHASHEHRLGRLEKWPGFTQ
ncbi:MAG: hypothetical protein R3B90_21790 [Planctomycetaceae bacterium]